MATPTFAPVITTQSDLVRFTSIGLIWNMPSNATQVEIERDGVAIHTGTGTGQTTSGYTHGYNDTGLSQDTAYSYRARGIGSGGEQGPWSNAVTFGTSTSSQGVTYGVELDPFLGRLVVGAQTSPQLQTFSYNQYGYISSQGYVDFGPYSVSDWTADGGYIAVGTQAFPFLYLATYDGSTFSRVYPLPSDSDSILSGVLNHYTNVKFAGGGDYFATLRGNYDNINARRWYRVRRDLGTTSLCTVDTPVRSSTNVVMNVRSLGVSDDGQYVAEGFTGTTANVWMAVNYLGFTDNTINYTRLTQPAIAPTGNPMANGIPNIPNYTPSAFAFSPDNTILMTATNVTVVPYFIDGTSSITKMAYGGAVGHAVRQIKWSTDGQFVLFVAGGGTANHQQWSVWRKDGSGVDSTFTKVVTGPMSGTSSTSWPDAADWDDYNVFYGKNPERNYIGRRSTEDIRPMTPPDTTAPDVASLSGNNVDEDTNELSWTAAGDAVSFQIYRDGQLIATQSGTTYSDTVDASESRSYTVRSADAAGNWSADSNTVSLQYEAPPPPDTTPPDVPVLEGTTDETGNDLSWSAPEDAISYRIYRDGSLIATQNGTSYTDSIDTTQSHSYTVRASDAAGNWTEDSNEVTLQYEEPPPPPDTTAPDVAVLDGENVDSSTNTLSWVGAADAINYRVYRDGELISTQTDAEYIDTVDASISHTYTVRSSDEAGNWSADSNSVTLQYEEPPPPPDTTAPDSPVLSGETSVVNNQLSWSFPTDAVEYQVYRDGSLVSTQTTRSYVDTINTTQSHTYKVKARDDAGNWSVDSNVVTLQYVAPPPDPDPEPTPDTTPPSTPQVTGQNLGAGSNQIQWTSSADATVFRVYRDSNILSTTFSKNFTDTVDAYNEHIYTVKASDNAGNWTPLSNSVTLKFDPPPPPPPSEPTRQYVSKTLEITWDIKGKNVDAIGRIPLSLSSLGRPPLTESRDLQR